ncbi:hypothetical protein [Senegalia sp. (in: firmicutes)]|uniref:hypothetical protein n=1 Tax=Senegalia sp. (in: firmicutes) TaxID=1924098 RepID=UPI003F98B848
MIRKEIRKKVQDKKGKTHDKLVCTTLVKEDNIYISIKNKGFADPVLVDMLDLIAPYTEEENIRDIRANISSIYKKIKDKAS